MEEIIGKVCRKCKLFKLAKDLKKDSRYKTDGFSSFCKECHKDYSIQWQKNNKDKVNITRKLRYQKNKDILNCKRNLRYNYDKEKWRVIKRLYNVSKEWYYKKLEDQNFKCAICNILKDNVKTYFSVDHDHSCCEKPPTCGKCNRGLLCASCNLSLGLIESNKNWFSLAERYFNENSKNSEGD